MQRPTAALIILLASCQRRTDGVEAVGSEPSAQAFPKTPVPSAPAVARRSKSFVAPPLPPDRQLAWHIEQRGLTIAPKDHALSLRREPFAIVVHVRDRKDFKLLVNASFKQETLAAARAGRLFSEMSGFSKPSLPDTRRESKSNQRRDLYVSDDTPAEWVECLPGAGVCSGFDAPCRETPEGLSCKRTIERFIDYRPGDEQWRALAESTEPELFVVFFLAGVERHELDRDWVTIRWKA